VNNKVVLGEFTSEILARETAVSRQVASTWAVQHARRKGSAGARLVRRALPAPAEVSERLARALLSLQVIFRLSDGSDSRWERELVAYIMRSETPKKVRTVEVMDWADLPEEVRNSRLGENKAEIVFKMYPWQKDAA